MLNEVKATRVRFDPQANATLIEIGGAPAGTSWDRPVVGGTLLLDADGLLAGVDLRSGSGQGWVVMLLSHEDVARTEPATELRVVSDAQGKPLALRVSTARARGSEMSIL